MRRATLIADLPAARLRHGHALRTVGAAALAALAAIATCATLAGCADSVVGPGALPTGTWGGVQGNVVVFADSATLDLPCAAGRIPTALATDADGRFDVMGQWTVVAGPIGPGGAGWQSARFTGRRSGDVLQLTVQLASGVLVGPLEFRRGVTGEFPRCL